MGTAKVSVIGAGIAGLTIANRLSQYPVDITLIDSNPYPGGRSVFYGCKAVDECVHCGVCLVREAVRELPENGNVSLLLSASPTSVRRNESGGFTIAVEGSPNPIDWKLCTDCGYCRDVCPQNAVQKIPGWKYVIDENCNNCGKCVDVCPVSAIQLDRPMRREVVEADGLALAAGFQPFDPAINRKWGYGSNPRVIHGTDLEHLFFAEEYLPKELAGSVGRMAFVQCVGSRNVMEGKRGCSRVCCAYALRMANRIKEEFPEIEVDFYYMDIQHFGKSFPRFWETVSKKVNFIRSNPISIKLDADGKPIVRYESPDGPGCREAAYDLVSLSHGMSPAEGSVELADMIGVDTNPDGFYREAAAGSGIFVAGACKRPMRIEDSVEDAAGISEKILQHLGRRPS